MDYRIIETDADLLAMVPEWEKRERIAVDFEGEFNLHIYGEHLCLAQVYDGDGFFLIDPRSESLTAKGLKVFFSSKVEKVWFDVQSDAALVFKLYGLRIENVYDVRALALALGETGNLLSVEEKYLGLRPETGKKRKQTSNWLARPVSRENVEYALSDVAHLLDLKVALQAAAAEKGVESQAEFLLKKAVKVRKPDPPWTKLPGWRNLGKRERIYAKHFFLARDRVARRFNVPAARVLDKHKIVCFAGNPPKDISKALEGENPRYVRFLREYLEKAMKEAGREASGV